MKKMKFDRESFKETLKNMQMSTDESSEIKGGDVCGKLCTITCTSGCWAAGLCVTCTQCIIGDRSMSK